MLGAVLGDIIGSYYEWNNVKTKDFPLVTNQTRYTDDTVMTLAVAKWLLEDPAHSEAQLIHCMQKLGRTHIRSGYGGRFKEWLMSNSPQPYNSWGNGSAMRVSPVGLFAKSEKEARELARITASVSHNHLEGIKGAEAVAVAVYTNRYHAKRPLDFRKKNTKLTLERLFDYNLNRLLDEIRPTYQFDVSCQGSVPEAIIAYLESESIEDCVRNAISIGGDSDTIAAIACSIFMAGENSDKEGNEWTKKFDKYLPNDLKCIMYDFEDFVFPKKPTFNSYAVKEWLYAGEYPGDRKDEKAKLKLSQFMRFGITHFIDLTEEGELSPYAPLLYEGASHHRFPIVDQGVPNSIEDVRKLVSAIRQIHEDNPDAKVYIHCWGGVGRTGTIIGCFLATELGTDYTDTIQELKRRWSDCPKSDRRISPENSLQYDFIHQYVNRHRQMDKRYTPERISILAENEIFVFGSNLAGAHAGGAARLAYERFGAEWGKGVGLHGKTYAIPTMQGGIETIKPYVNGFIRFATEHTELTFLVTRIGCGIAGFKDEEIAPLFKEALNKENIILPKEFADILGREANDDPFFLERFVKAQERMYELALAEIEDGQKKLHWIWYIFPQLSVLGRSQNSKYYGISGIEEAEAYLKHPILGERLREVTNTLLLHNEKSAVEIFGETDAMKVRSCMTLFSEVSPKDIFDDVIASFYHGVYDKATLEWM